MILCHAGFSQSVTDSINELSLRFKNFEYEKVITDSKRILDKQDSLTIQQQTEVLRMQATAFYSIGKLINAEKSFIDLLDKNSQFILDSSTNSPKIVSFFNSIKLKYLSSQIKDIENPKKDTTDIILLKQNLQDYKDGMLRSIIWPGWGHYYVDEPLKGKLLNIAALVTLAPGIYYSFETARLEKKYLNESDRSQIEKRYNSYNNAFSYRNYAMSAFAIIWFYTQYDYFFIDRPSFNQKFSIAPAYDPFNNTKIIRFSFQF